MSQSNISGIAQQLLNDFPHARIFAFFGAMGVGKTTLIKAICKNLDVEDNVCSPTFAIVNEYATRRGDAVFHFDFYRIKNLQEVFDIGYEEYFFSGDYCFVEWSELIGSLLPPSYLRVEIEETVDGDRRVVVESMV